MFVSCEHCQCTIETPEKAHSMLVVLQRIDTSGYAWSQCEQGAKNAHNHTYQHWHCGQATMLGGVTKCVREHYQENGLTRVPATQVQVHKAVLGTGLNCKVCRQALKTVAYRFCLTHATPENSVPDESHDELKEWCCSLEHARQSALATVASIQ